MNKKQMLCLNHRLELYLLEYYFPESEYEISDKSLHKVHLKEAEERVKEDDFEGALKEYEKAHELNPADVEICMGIANLYRNTGQWDKMRETVKMMYPFCYSRNDIAAYYRYQGCYYLETYQPEEALLLYTYSNYFYKSKWAEQDIKYLETAMNHSCPEYDIETIQKKIKSLNIEIQPAEQTLGLMYYTAQEAMEAGEAAYARELYILLYQMTQDEQIKELLISQDTK